MSFPRPVCLTAVIVCQLLILSSLAFSQTPQQQAQPQATPQQAPAQQPANQTPPRPQNPFETVPTAPTQPTPPPPTPGQAAPVQPVPQAQPAQPEQRPQDTIYDIEFRGARRDSDSQPDQRFVDSTPRASTFSPRNA